jgi:magnesium chelatase family protein
MLHSGERSDQTSNYTYYERRSPKPTASARLLANAGIGPAEVREYCRLDDVPACAGIGKSLLKATMQHHPGGTRMSARACRRILKLACTRARKAGLDLAGSEEIQTAHLAEAIQYRPRRQA